MLSTWVLGFSFPRRLALWRTGSRVLGTSVGRFKGFGILWKHMQTIAILDAFFESLNLIQEASLQCDDQVYACKILQAIDGVWSAICRKVASVPVPFFNTCARLSNRPFSSTIPFLASCCLHGLKEYVFLSIHSLDASTHEQTQGLKTVCSTEHDYKEFKD